MTAEAPNERILLFSTPTHECSYLPDRDASTVFVDRWHDARG